MQKILLTETSWHQRKAHIRPAGSALGVQDVMVCQDPEHTHSKSRVWRTRNNAMMSLSTTPSHKGV